MSLNILVMASVYMFKIFYIMHANDAIQYQLGMYALPFMLFGTVIIVTVFATLFKAPLGSAIAHHKGSVLHL